MADFRVEALGLGTGFVVSGLAIEDLGGGVEALGAEACGVEAFGVEDLGGGIEALGVEGFGCEALPRSRLGRGRRLWVLR